MLKLIRKYQLIILAIGGSLMMVVFLLQPIIERLAPDPRKKTVATLGDGSSYNGLDTQRAEWDLSVLKSVFPRAFQPIAMGGFGLDGNGSREAPLHWLLLTKQAEEMGIVGDDMEGRDWVDMIAQQETAVVVRQEVQQGAFTTQEEIEERFEALAAQVRAAIQRNINLALARSRSLTEDDVYRTLAKGRGVRRLYELYTAVPSFSDVGSLQAAKERFDAVAAETVLIPGQPVGASLGAPSDEELNAFFEQYKGEDPAENEYGIGYTRPVRVKMGWLTLDASAVSDSIEPDRVELRKMWARDRERPESAREYPGDFAGERVNIERDYKEDLVQEILIEADRSIRTRVLSATNALSKKDGLYVLPEDWASQRPSLESMAQAVVEDVQRALGVSVPLPSVTLATDRWLDVRGVSQLEGIGGAVFRAGSQTIQAFRIPQALGNEEAIDLIGLQEGIVQADPPAVDASGNRYYPVVYEKLDAGPALSIDDVGYDLVLRDYQSVKGYEALSARLDEFRSIAMGEGGIDGVIDAAMGEGDDISVAPSTVLVRSSGVSPAPGAFSVPPGLSNDAFIDAVLAATESLDPLATIEQLEADPIAVSVPIASATGVAVARVVAPRPVTIEAYRAQLAQIQTFQSQAEMREALGETNLDPFSFEALSTRYGLERVERDAGEDGGA